MLSSPEPLQAIEQSANVRREEAERIRVIEAPPASSSVRKDYSIR
jgi:hypothetical protein